MLIKQPYECHLRHRSVLTGSVFTLFYGHPTLSQLYPLVRGDYVYMAHEGEGVDKLKRRVPPHQCKFHCDEVISSVPVYVVQHNFWSA